MSRILVVDDEPIIRGELRRLLVRDGHDVAEAGSVAEAVAKGKLDEDFDLVITDLRLPGAAGTDLIKKGREPPVIVITAFATVKSAVEAMQRGAADYVPKPFDHHQLLVVVERLLAQGWLRRRVAAPTKDVSEALPVGGMIGDCPGMLEVRKRIARFAPTNDPVLICGESGTGKELVAGEIFVRSRRRDAPLVTVNCGAITKGLIEAELFGCDKEAAAAVTTARPGLFEAADGGTLFLDEIGELHAEAQACLLRVLEDGMVRRVGGTRYRKVDVRLIAATNRNLKQCVKAGAFRNDLYQRLQGFDIELPPLRNRDNDVEKIARHLVTQVATEFGNDDLELTPEALAAVRAYHWPGNVRELKKAIRHGAVMCDTGRITPELLGIDEPDTVSAEETAPADQPRDGRDDNYRYLILANQARLSETELARLLNVTRPGLYRIRLRLNIPRPSRNP